MDSDKALSLDELVESIRRGALVSLSEFNSVSELNRILDLKIVDLRPVVDESKKLIVDSYIGQCSSPVDQHISRVDSRSGIVSGQQSHREAAIAELRRQRWIGFEENW